MMESTFVLSSPPLLLSSIVPIVDPMKSVLIWTLTSLQSNRNPTYFLSLVFVLIWLTLSCFNQTFWPKGAPITRICLVGRFIFNSLHTFCLWLLNSITVVTAELIPAQMLVKTLQRIGERTDPWAQTDENFVVFSEWWCQVSMAKPSLMNVSSFTEKDIVLKAGRAKWREHSWTTTTLRWSYS